MYSARGPEGLEGADTVAGFLENDAQTGQGAEMARLERENAHDVGHRRTVEAGFEIGGGAGVVAFGEVRGVVDQRGEMVDRDPDLARL